MDVAFHTTNDGKFREVREILAEFGIRVQRRSGPLPELQADSLEEVVRGKLAAVRRSRGYTLVEDSGLFLAALRGFPGVYSAYVYRTLGFDPLLEWLKSRPRDALFRTVAGVRRGTRTWFFEGETRGTIADRPRGSAGFGFDPIFVPEGSAETYAEMPPESKSRVSHRAKAMRAVGRMLHGSEPTVSKK
jgi:XTP/dITP diphosphohydrolase